MQFLHGLMQQGQGAIMLAIFGATGLAATAAAGIFIPRIVISKIKALFSEARASGWLTDPKYPKRMACYKAALELLEEEVPDAGQGKEFYDQIAEFIHGHLPPVIAGTKEQWAKVVQKTGDEIDVSVKEELAAIVSVDKK